MIKTGLHQRHRHSQGEGDSERDRERERQKPGVAGAIYPIPYLANNSGIAFFLFTVGLAACLTRSHSLSKLTNWGHLFVADERERREGEGERLVLVFTGEYRECKERVQYRRRVSQRWLIATIQYQRWTNRWLHMRNTTCLRTSKGAKLETIKLTEE